MAQIKVEDRPVNALGPATALALPLFPMFSQVNDPAADRKGVCVWTPRPPAKETITKSADAPTVSYEATVGEAVE